jgi:hypothetical protein
MDEMKGPNEHSQNRTETRNKGGLSFSLLDVGCSGRVERWNAGGRKGMYQYASKSCFHEPSTEYSDR